MNPNPFNFFRINCLLNDSRSANFNSIILSIIHELFYESKNETKTLNEIYSYLTDYLKIIVEYDFLQGLISKSDDFDIELIDESVLVKVKAGKFNEIEITISSNSLEKHIEDFLVNTNRDFSYKNAIENLLYAAIFENINSFSVDNLKSLLPNTTGEFTQNEIDIFNAFLDYNDQEKNKIIYNILSRAVEFAILTSGKGVKELKLEVFNTKIFNLDTNIIFRLMGIGGDERASSLMSLLQNCLKIGINFQYTGKTHFELTNKLEQIVNFLKSAKVQSNIDILGDLSESHPDLFNDDFIVHYSLLRKRKIITTPEQYQRRLYQDYRDILNTLNASIIKSDDLDSKDVNYVAKILFAKKKEMKVSYGKKASEVDATNILIVRKQRGANSYNFSDVKSFYLTSDRSLNSIVSKETQSSLPETILPSQLFILCNPYFDNGHQNDYEEFIKFIKKRKTGFKYAGSQVLQYINSIRELTTEVTIISESLILYSDLRYNSTRGQDYSTESAMQGYKGVLQTILDEKLNKGQEAERIVNSFKDESEIYAKKKFKQSLIITRTMDVLITIGIVPIVVFLVKLITNKIEVQIVAIVICEVIKFYLSNRFFFFKSSHLFLYRKMTKKRRRKNATLHEDLASIFDLKESQIKNNIWT